MAKRRDDGKWVFFNVSYADGSRASNRRVPTDILGGLDGDDPARTEIEAQDQKIADASGKPARTILAMVRAPQG
jgi:hypothetical protein